jgi:hypothetical protein
MSTYFNDIQAALDTHLNDMDSTPIAWPNIEYKPTGTYLRPSFLPGETVQASMGDNGKDETNALYQVDVVSKRNTGRNTTPDTIADHFKRGTILQHNGLKLRVRGVSIGPSIIDGDWYFVPVTVNLNIFTGARS